jgi:hypothetical protein
MSTVVDFELVADYVGGVLDGTPEADRVSRLVATDSHWRQAADDLSHALYGVAADLSALRDTPEPMPADLVDRFNDFLKSPAMAARPAGVPRPALGERTLTRRREPRRWLKWAVPISVAAGVAALAGGVALRSDLPMTGPASSAEDSSVLSAGAPQPFAGQVMVTGRNYGPGDLGQMDAGRTSLSSATGASSLDTSQAPRVALAPAGLDRLATPQGLNSCLEAVAQRLPGSVTLVDYARFNDVPALIILIDSQAGNWVLVAGADCGAADANELYRSHVG